MVCMVVVLLLCTMYSYVRVVSPLFICCAIVCGSDGDKFDHLIPVCVALLILDKSAPGSRRLLGRAILVRSTGTQRAQFSGYK